MRSTNCGCLRSYDGQAVVTEAQIITLVEIPDYIDYVVAGEETRREPLG